VGGGHDDRCQCRFLPASHPPRRHHRSRGRRDRRAGQAHDLPRRIRQRNEDAPADRRGTRRTRRGVSDTGPHDRARGDLYAPGAPHHEALTVSVGPLTSVKPASVTLICCSFASHAACVAVLTRRLKPESRQRSRIAVGICSNASCAACAHWAAALPAVRAGSRESSMDTTASATGTRLSPSSGNSVPPTCSFFSSFGRGSTGPGGKTNASAGVKSASPPKLTLTHPSARASSSFFPSPRRTTL